MKTTTILFDFDGTLADTAPGILDTMRHTLSAMSKPIPSDCDMRLTIGLPLYTALQRLGSLSDDEATEAVSIYRRLFPTYELHGTTIYPGVVETLGELQRRGIRMGICTSRDEASLDLIMQPRGLAPFFESRVTNNDHLSPKPAPDMTLRLMEKMGVGAGEAIVVGDTTYDILMGNSAGCRTCAVTYGNHDEETLLSACPTFIISSFPEVLELL